MVKKVKGILLDVTYEDQEKSVIKVFVNGKWYYDKEFTPYLYIVVPSEEKEKTKEYLKAKVFEEGYKIKKIVEKETIHEKKALQIHFNFVKELVKARKELKETNLDMYEYDINFSKRYLIDKKLEPMNFVEIETEKKEIKSIKQSSGELDYKIGAFDLETKIGERFEIGKEPILMTSFATQNETKIISYNTKQTTGLKVVKNEKELLEELQKDLNKLDLIVTYNGDGFDWPYAKIRAEKNNFDFIINEEKIKSKRRGMNNSFELKGKQHVDAYQIMRFLQRTGSINIVKLDLENVSEKVFGNKKEKLTPTQINNFYNGTEKELKRLIDYNKKDAQVTLKITKEFLPLFIEVSRLTSQTIQDSTRSSTSIMVEDLLLKETSKRKVIAPNKPYEGKVNERIQNPIKGGFVKEPLAGLHEKIAVLDFASLYPSIIISHNISPETVNCEHTKCKKNMSPDGTWFCTKTRGLMPEILEKLLKQRLKLKKEYKEKKKKGKDNKFLFARQWALKIVLNSAYGYLGYARARWYSRESASATTSWARQYIQKTIEKAKKSNFDVLYGDSITKERFVTIKNPQGLIEIKNIKDFYKEIDELAWERGPKKIKHLKGYYALSVNPKTKKTEWKEITSIIKHKTNKKIYRVNQKYGETIVTEDHSLMSETQKGFKETKPIKMKNKKMFSVTKIPKSKNLIEIDLFEFIKKYNYTKRYKNQTKISQWHTDGKYIWFGFFNIKNQIKFKRNIKVNSKEFESLCRILGAYIAEGSATTTKTCKNKSRASISSSDIKWLEELQKDYHKLSLNAKTRVIQSIKKKRILTHSNKTIEYVDKTHKLQMMNETSAQLFNCLCGQKSKGKKLPAFIFNVPNKYKKILLEKTIEGNDSHTVNKKPGYSKKYIKDNFSYTTNSLGLISGMSLLLKQLNRTYTINYHLSKKAYTLKTSTKNNSRILTKIEKEKYDGEVYDLSVKDNENFVDSCGQILLHNTDSTFLLMKDKTKDDVENFLDSINKELPELMELELDGYYKRGIFVTKKEGGAAKKRYALMDEKENLKIVGFEYVRRDWCNLAKETQKKVIELILKKGKPEEAAEYVKEIIKKTKKGKIPKKDLAIITLLKRNVEDYSSIGPHVSAAKKAIEKGKDVGVGSMLSYIITKKGNSISEKAELEEFVKEGDYDPKYYIENQLIPAVIKILKELDYSEDDLKQGGKQTGLGSWC